VTVVPFGAYFDSAGHLTPLILANVDVGLLAVFAVSSLGVYALILAGWASKQWPLEYYARLATLLREKLGLPLVLNGAPGTVPAVPGTLVHESGIPGLIDATRRAALIVGVDSGPLHLAAALNKSGAAIFGPTDPVRNGPYGGDFQVFRMPGAPTTHRRGSTIDASMRAISPEQVFAALASRVSCLASSRP